MKKIPRMPWVLHHWHPTDFENWSSMPPLRDYLQLHCSGRGIFGIDGGDVSWGHADRLVFEFIMARHDFSSIAEFGTWRGVASLYFGITAAVRGIPFWTCDREDLRLDTVRRSWLPNMTFCQIDLLTRAPESAVIPVIEGKDVLLIVDNGNKELEAEKYGQFLGVGSAMIIHDWGTEVRPHVTGPTLTTMGYEQKYEQVISHLGSNCAFWSRVTT